MRHTKKMLLAVVVAVVGLIGTSTPASAASAGTAAFVVEVKTTQLGYPVLGGLPPGPTFNITIGANIACAGEIGGKVIAAGQCQIEGAGSGTGFCGQSSGTVWGVVRFVGGTVTYHINFTTAGSVLVATGTASIGGQSGVVAVEADAVPVPSVGGPSCATGTQTDFLVVGAAEFAAV